VLDDVGDLVALEAEVDRHHDAARCGRRVEQLEHPRGVETGHGDPLAGRDAHRVEARADRPNPTPELGEGQRAEGSAGLVGLVDDRGAIGIDGCAAGQEVVGSQRYEHGWDSGSKEVGCTERRARADAAPGG
jgi:hypothetical protein